MDGSLCESNTRMKQPNIQIKVEGASSDHSEGEEGTECHESFSNSITDLIGFGGGERSKGKEGEGRSLTDRRASAEFSFTHNIFKKASLTESPHTFSSI